jgi:phosphoglycerate kinase
MRSFRSLSSLKLAPGERVLVRVDWNVPLEGGLKPEQSLKIKRSLETIDWLQKKKAVVVLLTHLGRPKGADPAFSTAVLVPLLKRVYQLRLTHHAERVSSAKERVRLQADLTQAEPGSVHLLENVRFEAGEDKNAPALAKAYAGLASAFVNDAFASCHRAHASVVGIAKQLPAYAGKSLLEEDKALFKLLADKPRPRLAVIGGLKLSTKLPLLRTLVQGFDQVLVGGAMATTIKAAHGQPIGASFVEPDCFREAKRLATQGQLVLPEDIVVASGKTLKNYRVTTWDQIEHDERVVDVGPKTLRAWGALIAEAKVLVWNGPVGFFEVPAFGAGTRFVARAVGARSKGSAYGVAGGGETLAAIAGTKTGPWFDHLSTGGGALLEYLSMEGALPGLLPLMDETKSRASPKTRAKRSN